MGKNKRGVKRYDQKEALKIVLSNPAKVMNDTLAQTVAAVIDHYPPDKLDMVMHDLAATVLHMGFVITMGAEEHDYEKARALAIRMLDVEIDRYMTVEVPKALANSGGKLAPTIVASVETYARHKANRMEAEGGKSDAKSSKAAT